MIGLYVKREFGICNVYFFRKLKFYGYRSLRYKKILLSDKLSV